jgi:hypothetical protein
MVKKKKPSHIHRLFVCKEFLLGALAFLSIGLVLFEFFADPSTQTLRTLNHIDIVIACIFLADFCLSLALTGDRQKYLRHNWYFIFAAIPLSDSIAEALRGIRALRLIRLIRAGEHLDYSVTINKR